MLIQLTRTLEIPDLIKLERFLKSPEIGPKILFFSGGTALKKCCQELVKYTHNSIHIITPFDSGGSSAILRKAFNMPAIGDVRNRLLALADRSFYGNHEIFKLFSHRFPKDQDLKELSWEIDEMIGGRHDLIKPIPDPMRKIIRHHLYLFKKYMPKDFDLCKASLGNLILTAGYLDNRRNFDIIVYIFSKLVRVLGIVRPVINKDYHLVTQLENDKLILGQHMLTGKEVNKIKSKVKQIDLSKTLNSYEPVKSAIREKIKLLINTADLICYPIGSFYSSLIANLLPKGISKAICQNKFPKIFIPNSDNGDPETFGMSLTQQIETLLFYLRKDDPNAIAPTDVLNFIVVDSQNGLYPEGIDTKFLNKMGIKVIDMPLISESSYPRIDEKLLIPVILSLA